jgi:UDP-N-acetylmuramoylalanine--D-glutamate ligase
MSLRELKGVKVLVVGLAKSGLAAVELLLEQGARVWASDCKSLAEIPNATDLLARRGVPFLPQIVGGFRGFPLIVISPGVPADHEALQDARRRGSKVIGELELASWFLKGRVIGITGSNGKTTTTALIGHILRECGITCQVGGNIGTPPASMVAGSSEDRWNVLEVSSFQLETINVFRAHTALCMNVTPDHLDRHGTLENYANAKARLFETQQAGDWAVLNAADATCRGYSGKTKGQTVWFNSQEPVECGLWLAGDEILSGGVPVMKASEVPLPGRHNLENVMAAAAAAQLAGADIEGIAAAVRTFPGVEHRLEFVRAVGGVRYYNDSKATNVDATLKALAAFPGGLWMILGGKDKHSDYAALKDALAEKAKGVLLIGAAADIIAGHLAGDKRLPAPVHCGDLKNAVAHAREHAHPGDIVVLAPACASFDQFENFEHRGRKFKELVTELEE